MKERLRPILDDPTYYATILVAVVLLALDILNVFGLETVVSGLLAVLILIACGNLAERKARRDLHDSVERLRTSLAEPSALDFFTKWHEDELERRLEKAREVSCLAFAPLNTIINHFEAFEKILRNGGHIRFLLVNPEGDAMKMADARSPSNSEVLLSEAALSLQRLRELGRMTSAPKEKLEVKLVDYWPGYVISMIDDSYNGIVFVTLYNFRQNDSLRPSMKLLKDKDGEWYECFRKDFYNLWNWKGSVTIDLQQSDQASNGT